MASLEGSGRKHEVARGKRARGRHASVLLARRKRTKEEEVGWAGWGNWAGSGGCAVRPGKWPGMCSVLFSVCFIFKFILPLF